MCKGPVVRETKQDSMAGTQSETEAGPCKILLAPRILFFILTVLRREGDTVTLYLEELTV
jgi:hypothetical protein